MAERLRLSIANRIFEGSNPSRASMKYEAHITISLSSEEEVKKVGLSSNWTFSKILGDPIMGKEAYCYLTQYKENANELLKEMNDVASCLKLNNCKVLRCKIELICYDTKTNVNILNNLLSLENGEYK
jgi:hypothetical protein